MTLAMFNDDAYNFRSKLIGIYLTLIVANLLAWGCALIAFRNYPVLLGTSLLAYILGLRHAFDADHIAAIDNVTRKLMQENKRPVAAGFFFSLGHSSVVVALSIAIAATAAQLHDNFSQFKAVAGVIGSSISAVFLFAIAAANVLVLAGVFKTFHRVKQGGHTVEQELDQLLAQRPLFRRLFRLVDRSWHMYPVGVLFGLGFDTATEIGLLGISAAQGSHGLPIWAILVFPALFTAGMSLADTLDSTLMMRTYGWALANPIRKIYYNMTIIFVSVLIALLVGGVELLGLIAGKLSLDGSFWGYIAILSENFGALGVIIVTIFAISWGISVAIYRAKGYDDVPQETASMLE